MPATSWGLLGSREMAAMCGSLTPFYSQPFDRRSTATKLSLGRVQLPDVSLGGRWKGQGMREEEEEHDL